MNLVFWRILYKGKAIERSTVKTLNRFRIKYTLYRKVKLPAPDVKILNHVWASGPTNCVSSTFQMEEETLMISVIIPAYNAMVTLPNLMEDLLCQKTVFSYEIIVIDDGSTDDTKRLTDQYQAQHPKLVRVYHQKNAGVSAARNTGIDHAHGRYFAFVDSDDRITDDYLEEIVRTAEINAADIVKCGFEAVRNGYVAYSGIADGFLWGGVYHRRIFECIRFPEGFWYEDMINQILLFRVAKKTVTIEKILYSYILSPSQGSAKLWYKGNVHSLDQIYLIQGLQEEYKKLGFHEDEILFKQTLHECSAIMLRRIRGLNINIQMQVFLICRDIINKLYHQEYEITDKDFPYFEAIYNGDFARWRLLGKTF